MLRNWSLNPLAKVAIGILRKYGTDAHIYLPGVGTVNGITAGNYLDSAGVTAASVDNPVGLSLDALQAMTQVPELAPALVSGAWSTVQLGWSISGGVASVNSAIAGSTLFRTGASVVGEYSIVTYTIGAVSGTGIAPIIGGSIGALKSSPGTYTEIIKAGDTTGVGMYAALSNTVGTVTSLSIKQIPGIHATQGTTANKPILRRGLLNLLTYSQDASNAAWAKISASATASKIIEAAGSSQHYISQSIDMPDGGVTFAAAFAPAERSWATMYLGSVNSSVWFNSSTGVIGTTGASITASIASLANGYKLCVITGTQTGLGAITRGLYIADADNSNTYTGDGTSGILFGGAGLFQGTYTAQQIIDAGGIPLTTTAAASNPSAGKYSWQFDGSNDSLSLSAPLFQMSDDHCVIAGCTLGSNATTRYLINTGAGAGSQRVCALFITGTNSVNVGWTDDVTAANIASPSTYPGQTLVVSGVKQANAKRLRINGAQAGSTENTVMGVTTLTGGGAIGDWRPSGGNNWIGSIYPVIAIKGTLSDSDLLVLERYVGMGCGVSI